MKTPTTSDPIQPAGAVPPDISQIAFEAEQQAARVRALVQVLAKAYQDTDEELLFESVERLLDPLCDWTHTLFEELFNRSHPIEPSTEGQP